MAGYDPKAKRAHSATAPDGPAPVDDLLGAPAAAPPTEPAPTGADAKATAAPVARPTTTPRPAAPPRPETRPLAPTPAAATGPDPKVLAALLAAVLAVLFVWRHRRRGST